jgi:hypothetical protein
MAGVSEKKLPAVLLIFGDTAKADTANAEARRPAVMRFESLEFLRFMIFPLVQVGSSGKADRNCLLIV